MWASMRQRVKGPTGAVPLGMISSTAVMGVPPAKTMAVGSVVSQQVLLKLAHGMLLLPEAPMGAQKSPAAVLTCARSWLEVPGARVSPVAVTLMERPAPELAVGRIGGGVAVVPTAWLMFQPTPATDAYAGSAAIIPMAQSVVMAMKLVGVTVALLPVIGPTNVYA